MTSSTGLSAEPPFVCFRGRHYRSSKTFRTGTHRAQAPHETFRAVKPYLARAGVTRVADVTGLDNVGVPTTLALRPNALTLACSSGKGLTLDQALVSGAMEAFELYAAETASIPSIRASYREISARYSVPAIVDLPLSRRSLFSPEWPLYWFLGWDLISQSEVAVPLASVGMQRNKTLVASAGSFHVTSNGLGAGNSFLEAVTAGLYEVVERDAFACNHYAALHRGHRVPLVPEEVLCRYPLVATVLEHCAKADVKVVVHDCAADTNVPTYFAVVYDRTDRGVSVTRGSGSHFDPEVAILRGITEALQARLNFIAGSRDDIFRMAFARGRATWGPAVEAIERSLINCPQADVPPARVSDTFEEDIAELLRCIQSAGVNHVVVADLTPQDFPVHIVRVLAPGLENYLNHGYRVGRRAIRFASSEQ